MKNKSLRNVFFVFSMISFLGSWILSRTIMSSQEFENVWFLLLLLFLDIISFSMFVLLTKEKKASLFLAFICVLGAVFMAFGKPVLMGAFIIFCLGLFYMGIKRVKDEQKNKIRLNLYLTLRRGVPVWGIAISILLSVGLYSYLKQNQEFSKIPIVKFEIPQKITDSLIDLAVIFSEEDFGLISNGATVDEYIEVSITSRANLEQDNLLNNMQYDLENSVNEDRKILSSQLGLELTGNEQMSEVIDKILENRLNGFINGQTSNEPLMPLGAAVALFVAASSLFWFLGFVAIWTSIVIFYILLKLQKIAINKEEREVEIID